MVLAALATTPRQARVCRSRLACNAPAVTRWPSRTDRVRRVRGAGTDRQQLFIELQTACSGINRGLFGVPASLKARIHDIIAELETGNPTPEPLNAEGLSGSWRLIYSTISILGTKRSKLGLREFVKIGDMFQDICTDQLTAVNRISFAVTGFMALHGELTIRASYTPASRQRVNVTFQSADLKPSQFQELFDHNFDLLLSIFNPAGWLDITYFDGNVRVGRDDKGNIFVLEKCQTPADESGNT